MATYYVRNDGNNANTGTGPATNQAWQTIAYAFANMTLTTGVNTLYIAPGVYRESVTLTVTPTVSNTLVIAGDPTASQFSGITADQVRITGAVNDSSTSATGTRINTNAKSYITIQDVVLEGATSQTVSTFIISGTNTTINRVVVYGVYYAGTPAACLEIETPNTTNNEISVKNSIIFGGSIGIRIRLPVSTSGVSGVSVQNCRVICGHYNSTGIYSLPQSGATTSSVLISNCFVTASTCVYTERGNTTNTHTVQNCILAAGSTGIQSTATNIISQQYNIINCNNQLNNVSSSATTVVSDFLGIDLMQNLLQGFGDIAPFGTLKNSRNTGFGIATNAPVTDAYGVTWTGATPDAGAVTYRSLSTIGSYLPTERNASAITIAPGSTSQSIELYLGATGLTFSTSGLAAYYVRNQSAPVAITLVTQTATGAWTSGGFAEISSSLVPGVYRLDVPNAAFAAGASDVTIVVRGASGTNGAVLTVTLSSGGLTAAQTAAAVWDEARASHTTAGTFGQYVNAELVTPVTSAALVRMGPFEVRADGLGASDPLDIQKGAQHGIDIQCVDNNGAGIDITSATVTAKVYNSGATLVDTYSCTATYAADGRAQFTIDTTVTNVPGTYTATITRTTGASDTQIFGPLRIYVRDI